ncbi:hypothetical protein CKA38_03450 [Ereboglobus luteus]|uniref:Uncharacterized protein n=1 Tax=Ereboglobus luteus TaxID=1796921 RepID=A0A2U8E1M5_9BACT|nr:hypothetical protein CKA38_03450 [Ereboglobus luteus]
MSPGCWQFVRFFTLNGGKRTVGLGVRVMSRRHRNYSQWGIEFFRENSNFNVSLRGLTVQSVAKIDEQACIFLGSHPGDFY